MITNMSTNMTTNITTNMTTNMTTNITTNINTNTMDNVTLLCTILILDALVLFSVCLCYRCKKKICTCINETERSRLRLRNNDVESQLENIDMINTKTLYTNDPQTSLTITNYKMKKIIFDNTNIIIFNNEKTQIHTYCSICLNDLIDTNKTTSVRILKCMHMFHAECIDNWFVIKNMNKTQPILTCPVCKTHVNVINTTLQL